MSNETNRPNRSRCRRPIDPVVVAHTAGRFTPRPVAQRPRKQHWRKQCARGPPDDDDKDAYSIREFCRRHGISESFFFKLQARGEGVAQAARRGLRDLKENAARRRAPCRIRDLGLARFHTKGTQRCFR